jgi:hypothetical protein
MRKGSEKHNTIKRVLERTRGWLGDLPNLRFEYAFNANGLQGRLDVIDTENKDIYDFKFGYLATLPGVDGMSRSQYRKYRNAFPDYRIYTVNKKGDIKRVIKFFA